MAVEFPYNNDVVPYVIPTGCWKNRLTVIQKMFKLCYGLCYVLSYDLSVRSLIRLLACCYYCTK